MSEAVTTLATDSAGALVPTSANYPSLPADMRAAIDRYAGDLASGKLTLGDDGHVIMPRESEAWICDHLASHLPADDMAHDTREDARADAARDIWADIGRRAQREAETWRAGDSPAGDRWQVIADGIPWEDSDGNTDWTRPVACTLQAHLDGMDYSTELVPA